ncbi:hypothetical protein GCM10023259_055740 [Thermocatellispora tengchongensis]
MAEYAEIERLLYTPAVLRDHRLGRRLRRQMEAMEALVFDGSAQRWDPYDPYDAVIVVEPLREPGEPAPAWPVAPGIVMRSCREHAARLGWRTVPLDGESAVAVHAGESGAGAWSVFKRLGGVHAFFDPYAAPEEPGRADERADERVEVRVWPDDGGPAELPGAPEDWREEVYCRRGPSCGGEPDSAVWITHVPSGRRVRGRDHRRPGKVSAGRANAPRLMRALLLADGVGPGEPAYAYVRPPAEPAGRHALWGPSSFDVERIVSR